MFSCARSAIAALIVVIAIPASGKKEKGAAEVSLAAPLLTSKF